MKSLDFLWALEGHTNSLDELKKSYDLLLETIGLGEVQLKLKKIKKELKEISHKIENNRRLLREKEQALEGENFKIKEIDKELYNGQIQDIKHLEHLTEKKEKTTRHIDKLETELLLLMEEEASLEKGFRDLEVVKRNYEGQLKDKEKEYERLQTLIMQKIEKKAKQIYEIENKIETGILEQYKKIRQQKLAGIVPVTDYVCGGCHMTIPTYLGKALKMGKEIILCDYCGRILYYVKEELDSKHD